MTDPFGSMSSFLSQFRGFAANPMQFLAQRGIQGQNPAEIVQGLLNSGRMTQQQFNQYQRMAKQIQSNPMFGQMFGNTP